MFLSILFLLSESKPIPRKKNENQLFIYKYIFCNHPATQPRPVPRKQDLELVFNNSKSINVFNEIKYKDFPASTTIRFQNTE